MTKKNKVPEDDNKKKEARDFPHLFKNFRTQTVAVRIVFLAFNLLKKPSTPIL